MKSITIAGNIGRDAETRSTPGGDKVTGFTVAVDDGFGERKRTLWFDCAIWGNRGEKLATYLTKGSKVAVSGDFSTHEKDGKTYLKVKVAEVTLQGGGERRDEQRDSGSDYNGTGARGGAPAGGAPGGGFDDLDDIPFAPEWR
jgi:single-strand DNA-binding protein